MVVWTYACPSVRIQPVFLGICALVFSEISQMDRDLKTVKSERSEFSSKTHVCPKTVKQGSKCTQNRILRIFHKFCYHFLMQGTSIERPYNFLFCYANPVSGKNLYCQVMTKMSNQIAWFFDNQYLWKECIDILFFYMEIFTKER